MAELFVTLIVHAVTYKDILMLLVTSSLFLLWK